MEEMYEKHEYNKSIQKLYMSQNPSGSKTSEKWFHQAIALILVLLSVLLLAGIIGLGVYFHTSVSVLTKEGDQLKDNLDVLTKERDQLKANLNIISENVLSFQNFFNLTRACSEEWMSFKCSCYYLSTMSDSWTTARDDCLNRGGNLVVIESEEEQMFLSNFTSDETWNWIGLRKEEENTWTWIDGTPMTQSYWEENQDYSGDGSEDYGEEDCAHIRTGKNTKLNWNDRSCHISLPWICEKNG